MYKSTESEFSSAGLLPGMQQDELYDVKTLKILEWLVVTEIQAVEGVDRNVFPEKWARREKKKIGVQNILNQLGCSLMAERLLTSDKNEVIAASIRLLIVLLDGGNTDVQNTLETYWLGTREERFFYCMHERIKQAISDLREAKAISSSDAKRQEASRPDTPHGHPAGASAHALRVVKLSRQGSSSLESLTEVEKSRGLSASSENDLSTTFYRKQKDGLGVPLTDEGPSIAGSGGVDDGQYAVIRSIMRLLQLLVEGHNYRMQDDGAGRQSALDAGFLYAMLLYTVLPHMSEEHRASCEQSRPFVWFRLKLGRIEILRELPLTGELRLFNILFPIPEICTHMRDDTKSRFLSMRKRDTAQDKIEDFINQSGDIVYEIKNQARVAGNEWLRQLAEGYVWWWWGAYVATLLLNVGNMLCMIAPTGYVEFDDFSMCPTAIDVLRVLIGLLQLTFW
ncbi:hypothetical protein HK405_014078, partial [Cladochytrium tenue]